MSASEYLERAIALARIADDLLKGWQDNPLPDQILRLQVASSAAGIGRLYTAIRREVWLEEGDPIPYLPTGVPAPVYDLHTTKAPARPEKAAGGHDPREEPS